MLAGDPDVDSRLRLLPTELFRQVAEDVYGFARRERLSRAERNDGERLNRILWSFKGGQERDVVLFQAMDERSAD